MGSLSPASLEAGSGEDVFEGGGEGPWVGDEGVSAWEVAEEEWESEKAGSVGCSVRRSSSVGALVGSSGARGFRVGSSERLVVDLIRVLSLLRDAVGTGLEQRVRRSGS